MKQKNNTHPLSQQVLAPSEEEQLLQFREDVLKGLLSTPKRLSSKYFYNQKGDELFQQIMGCPEYYLTRCELEIFQTQAESLVSAIKDPDDTPFDLIELGVGDGTKSRHLLVELLSKESDFSYFPIDISGNILSQLEENLAGLKGLKLRSLEGDYFDMLAEATKFSGNRKVVLFLGSNIGNMSLNETHGFCKRLRSLLHSGDMALIGFDLKKNPHVILDAYNDKAGITRDFNLNLLQRINRELNGGFDINQFSHYQSYDPETGACKSYLVSRLCQTVEVAGVSVPFNEGEWIFMEISQKFSIDEIETLAANSGFSITRNLLDSKQWFVDSIWKAI